MNIEFFFAAGCNRCAATRAELQAAAEALPDVHWCEVDIGKEPMRAVDAGVVSTPAVAIEGDLVFRTSPTASALKAAIEARRRDV
jgi:hypothetical protein